MTTDVLSRLQDEATEREQRKAEQFTDLVISVVDGTMSADEASARLAACGRTVGELTKAVYVASARAALRAKVEAGEAATQEYLATKVEIETIDQEYRELLAKCAAKRRPLDFRVQELQTAMQAGQSAKGELLRTCPDNELRGRAADNRRAMNRLTDAKRDAQHDLERCKTSLAAAKERKDAREIERTTGIVERKQAAVDGLVAQLNTLVTEANSLVQQMREV